MVRVSYHLRVWCYVDMKLCLNPMVQKIDGMMGAHLFGGTIYYGYSALDS